MRLLSILCVFGGVLREASAEKSEIGVHVISSHELVLLGYPKFNGVSGAVSSSGAPAYLPRLGVQAAYGITHQLSFGFGVSAAIPRTITVHARGYQDIVEGQLHASYHDIWVPAVAEVQWPNGKSGSWLVNLSTGLALTHWTSLYMTELPGSQSRDLPITPESIWRPMWFGQLSCARAWRPHDAFGLQLGAMAAVKQQGDVHLGLYLSADGFFGVGF